MVKKSSFSFRHDPAHVEFIRTHESSGMTSNEIYEALCKKFQDVPPEVSVKSIRGVMYRIRKAKSKKTGVPLPVGRPSGFNYQDPEIKKTILEKAKVLRQQGYTFTAIYEKLSRDYPSHPIPSPASLCRALNINKAVKNKINGAFVVSVKGGGVNLVELAVGKKTVIEILRLVIEGE